MTGGETATSWLQVFREADTDQIPRAAIRPARPEGDVDATSDLNLPRDMGGADPRVSVIIPTYEDAEYLPDAIESVAAQTMTDLEVVIVDSSREAWVADIADERDWIQYKPTSPEGVSAARNDGITAAAGEFLAFLDADDYWHPRKLERQLSTMGREHVASYTGYYFLNYWSSQEPSIDRRDNNKREGSRDDIELLTRRIDGHISTVLCRSDVVPSRPFEEDLRNFEDVVFTIELFRDHAPVHITDPLVVRRLRPDSLADRTSELEKCRHRIAGLEYLRDRYPEYAAHAAEAIALEIYRSGVVHLRDGDPTEARRRFRQCLLRHPSVLKVAGMYLLTFLPVDPRSSLDHLDRLMPSES